MKERVLPGITLFVRGGTSKPWVGYWRGELAWASISESIFVPILRKTELEILELRQTKTD